METGQKGVKYGLELRKPPSKTTAPLGKKVNVFGDDDAEDELTVEEEIARHAVRKQSDKKTQDLIAAAVAEDASVFDYDSHFDTIQQAREEPKRQEKLQRQSKYVGALLEKAEDRKREQEILMERRLAKEREAEDHLFGDKEKFVTAAYKKKLEEEKKWKDEQAKKEAEEEMNAADKKGHMGDFYRNILKTNVAFRTSTSTVATESKEQENKKNKDVHDGLGKEGEGAAIKDSKHPPLPPQSSQPKETTKAAVLTTKKGELYQHRDGGGTDSRAALEQQQGQQRGGRLSPPLASAAGGEEHKGNSPRIVLNVKKDKEEAIAAARERYLARKRKLEGQQQ